MILVGSIFCSLRAVGNTRRSKLGRELVVGADRLSNLGAQFDGIITQRGEPFVQFSGQIEQLLGVIGERLLLPGIGHGFQHGPERDRRGERHFARERIIHQCGIGFERGLQ